MDPDTRVLNTETRQEGYVASKMTDVVVEDDFGDMNYQNPKFVSVVWDGGDPGIPIRVSAAKLVKIEGYRIQRHPPPGIGPCDPPSQVFATREKAVEHCAEVFGDPALALHSIFPVNKGGIPL
jgi:hypothetical protein